MSKVGLVILLFLLAGECNAQNYFVFIDAGNRQPFYVRLDSQFYSSSADGHIILSRLRDSLYDITIGFPGQPAEEQHYELGIRGKDQAFEIRDHGGDAPGLFDLQANEWLKRVYARGKGADEFRSTGTKKDDAFSRMMAGVVHDTAVLYSTYSMEQALPATTISSSANNTPISNQDTAAAIAATAAASPVPSVGSGASVAKPDTSFSKPDSGVALSPPTAKTPDSINLPIKSVDTGALATTKPVASTADPAGQLYRPIPVMAASDTIGKTTLPASVPTTTPATVPSSIVNATIPATPGTTAPATATAPATPPATTSATATAPAMPQATAPATATGPGTPEPTISATAIAPAPTITPAAATVPPPTTTSAAIAPPTSSTAVPDTATQLYRPIVHQPAADTAGLLFRPIAGTSAHKAAPVVDSLDKTPLFRPIAQVTKLSERRSPHSVRLVYADQSQGKKADTIVVIIPIDTVHATLTRSHGANANADSLTSRQKNVFRPLAPAGIPPADNARSANQVDTQRLPAKGAVVYVNSDCHNFANDLDVDKLRAKMLEAAKDDDRIAVARKAFKVKCFYTRYIRALSEVFTTDATKYRFFEAAWPFAADEHFHELSNLFADPVYSGKFRILTSHL